MDVLKMRLEVMLALKHPKTHVTLEGLDVTNAMNRRQVPLHIAFMHELLFANITFVLGVRVAAAAALRVRRVVISAHRWLVAERQTLDSPLRYLQTEILQTLMWQFKRDIITSYRQNTEIRAFQSAKCNSVQRS